MAVTFPVTPFDSPVGDHAKNLAEQIIYIVKGMDVRHNPVGTVEDLVR